MEREEENEAESDEGVFGDLIGEDSMSTEDRSVYHDAASERSTVAPKRGLEVVSRQTSLRGNYRESTRTYNRIGPAVPRIQRPRISTPVGNIYFYNGRKESYSAPGASARPTPNRYRTCPPRASWRSQSTPIHVHPYDRNVAYAEYYVNRGASTILPR